MANDSDFSMVWTDVDVTNATTTVITDDEPILIGSNQDVFDNPGITGPSGVTLRNETWVIPLLALSSLNVFAILCFEVYVLVKSCGNRRHLFLGQTLLFGIFLCSALGYPFVLTPHWAICLTTRIGVGIAYVIVFSTLLVKCFFLLALHSGIYLNSAYQSLLLFFATSVQIAIGVQWIIYRSPDVISLEGAMRGELACKATPVERLEYLAYPMILLLIVVVASVRGRSLKENNKEALYIGITVGILVVVWVAWTSVMIIFDRRYEDPAQAFGLVCTGTVVFLLVFIPKAVQLSLASRNKGSNCSQSLVYSPSFLHLQPQAVLQNPSEGTLVKPSNSAVADYCRGYSTRVWRCDYPTFYQMEPQGFIPSDKASSQRKSNV